jgi:hypothetical protein
MKLQRELGHLHLNPSLLDQPQAPLSEELGTHIGADRAVRHGWARKANGSD